MRKDPFRLNPKPQKPAAGVWHNKGDERFTSPTKAAAKKKYGTTSQGLLPWLTAGAIGLGGGGFASQQLTQRDVVTPQTLERHIDRVLDKIDDQSEDIAELKASLKHLEKEVTDIKYDRARMKPTFEE